MIIENNPKELEAMKKFHQGNRQEGLRLQEEFVAEFRKEKKKKDHCLVKKRVVIMATVKSVWQFTELIRNMFPIV